MKILIVEDDLSLSDVLAFTLRRAGYDIVAAYDGLTALQLWEMGKPDLIVLDLNLPKLNGLAVCRQIRSRDRTPIIILSVRGGDDAIIQGLEMGADDYIVKPFSPSQLVARIRAVARRAGVAETTRTLELAGLSFDRSRHEVQLPGSQPMRLAPLEAKLLEALMLNAGQVLTADALIAAVWGAEGGDRAMLKQLVYRLRAKLDPADTPSSRIETIPGIGYSLIESDA